MYLGTVLASIFGYLIGSISFSIILVFMKTKKDVRNHGSKNAGATNVSRILGKKWGLIIVGLDMLKVFITYLIAVAINCIPNELFDKTNLIIPTFFALVGHCYPVYYKFKGGKAVSCILAIAILVNTMLFVVFILTFLVISLSTKKISPASLISALIISILCFIPQIYGMDKYILDGSIAFDDAYSKGYQWLNFSNLGHNLNPNTQTNLNGHFYDSILSFQIIIVLSSLVLTWKHIPNIKRLVNKTEPNFFEYDKEKRKEKYAKQQKIMHDLDDINKKEKQEQIIKTLKDNEKK